MSAGAPQQGDRSSLNWLGLAAIPVAFLIVPLLAVLAVFGALFVVVTTGGAAAACTTSSSSTSSSVTELEVRTIGDDSLVLDETQLRNASTVVAVGRELGVPERGLQVALMTALQESKLRMLANTNVPDSLSYPHEGTGTDHDSVNIFQQRPHWGTLADLMTARYAAEAFFGGPGGPNGGSPRGLLDIAGWEAMPLGKAAQTVQVSAYPDAYDQWEPAALTILQEVGGAISCTGTQIGTAAYPLDPGYQMTSGYGPRSVDVPGASDWHAADDFQHWPNPCGSTVYATLPGTVVLDSTLWLSIQHPDGFVVSYLHMYKSDRVVTLGDKVEAGQVIGKVGNVPPSGGCHLDIRINVAGNTNPEVAKLTLSQNDTRTSRPASRPEHQNFVNPEDFFRLFGLELCPPDSCRRL